MQIALVSSRRSSSRMDAKRPDTHIAYFARIEPTPCLGILQYHVLLAAYDAGQVNIADFVSGCMQLKGPATNFDVQTLYSQFSMLESTLESSMDRIELRLQSLVDE